MSATKFSSEPIDSSVHLVPTRSCLIVVNRISVSCLDLCVAIRRIWC